MSFCWPTRLCRTTTTTACLWRCWICTDTYACEAECPKQIKRQNIARLNRQWIGQLFGRDRRD